MIILFHLTSKTKGHSRKIINFNINFIGFKNAFSDYVTHLLAMQIDSDALIVNLAQKNGKV